MAVLLIHPGGMQIGPIRQIQGPQRFTLGQTQILLYYGEPSPYSPLSGDLPGLSSCAGLCGQWNLDGAPDSTAHRHGAL